MVVAAMAAAALAADPAFGRVTERAKACITAHAAEVERVEESLSSAADFLLGDLCAEQVEVRERYANTASMLANIRKAGGFLGDDDYPGADPKMAARAKAMADKQRDAYSKATISEETGEVVLPSGSESSLTYGFFIAGLNGRASASADLRAFAARALLDARKARLARP